MEKEIQTVKCTCPNCGAELDIEANRQEAFCTYCGHKIIVKKEEVKEPTKEELAANRKKDRTYMICFFVVAVVMIVLGNTILKTTFIAPILTVFGVLFAYFGILLVIPPENRMIFGKGKGLFNKK